MLVSEYKVWSQIAFLRRFRTENCSGELDTFYPRKGQQLRKSLTHVRVVVDHKPSSHLQRSPKLEDLALLFCLVSLTYQDFISILSMHFWSTILLSHNRLMRCLSSMLSCIAVTALLLATYLKCCW